MMDTARRLALSSLLVHVAVIFFVGISAELLPAGIPSSVSSPFLYSVDVLLEGSADDPLPLGIRRGQTAVQAAESFCIEQGFDKKMQTVLMPQLIKVLEAGMATSSVGHNAPAEYDTAAVPTQGPGNQFERMNRRAGVIEHPTANDDPTVTLEVSLDGGATRTLYYYAGQDPNDIASKFCAASLDSSSAPEAFARCTELLSAGIIERLAPSDASSNQGYEVNGSKERRETAAPWLVVPLNVDGLETTLQIHRGSIPDDLAEEFCRREEVAFSGATFDSCFSQIIQIARRAIMVQTSRERDGTINGRGGARPYAFNIPVMLSGVEVYAEFRTDETPRESALRFCVPNLPAIESALGTIGNSGGMDDSSGLDQRVKVDEREALLGTCAMIVEDAINAVLLGLRERVLEAEMALAMTTEPMTG